MPAAAGYAYAPYTNPSTSALSPSDSTGSNFTLLYKYCREISNGTVTSAIAI
ncbi:hypothetical protein [uncultured Nostoc sp.]|uniref:hypothetical protein n=1 Tax=uncultured Nostoc sp. TaxID=340711 RepID=UPI0035CC6910